MVNATEQHILDALKSVIDPQTGRDVVALGMIQGLALNNGNAQFALGIDPARATEYEPLRRAAERAVAALPGIVSATALLTAERAAAAPAAAPRPGPPKITLPGVRSIVAVASGKGGVGKSTTTTNLACALARRGLKVGLLDADIYGPSQPRLMGISGKPRSRDGKIMEPMHNHGVAVMSIGFLLDEDKPVIWRGPMVVSALQQMLRDVAWGTLDILLVDMPPGTGDIQLSMAQTVPLTGAVIVSTPQDIALIDARRGLAMFRRVEVPVFGFVENMSYFACPHCGGRTDIFGHGGAQEEAAKLDTDFLGEVPLHLAIRETSDAGTPIVVTDPDSAHAQAYAAIAARVWSKVEAQLGGGRAAPRIVMG
jgi:ATP-binding protein involved in chromosome partitioning